MEKGQQSENVSLFSQLKTFMEFVCEGKAIPIDDVMVAAMTLLKECPSSRLAVLKFYRKLVLEYCQVYSQLHSKKTVVIVESPLEYLPRFVQALIEANDAGKNKVKEEKETTEEEKKIDEDGPSSPSREAEEMDLEAGELPGSQKENDISIITGAIDMHVGTLSDIFVEIQEANEYPEVTASISDWALELVVDLSRQYSLYYAEPGDQRGHQQHSAPKADHIMLMTALSFWLQCQAMQMLLRIILTSACTNIIDAKALISRLVKESPFSDWVLAHLCTNLSTGFDLKRYIEELIIESSSFSTTFILSYVSEHNPQAIVNCSKSNLPLLLKLCTNSKPLLEMLAYDVVKKVDMDSLNRLAESHTTDDLDDYIIYCVLNAPNAFELLKLSFDLVVHPQRSDALCSRLLNIMNRVTKQIHAYVYEARNAAFDSASFPIISLLRNNVQQLIAHPSIARSTSLKKLQLRLLNLICICYGSEFITEVFHDLMNFSTYQISLLNFEDVKLNPLLVPLFNSLRLHFGFNTVQNCIKDTLKLYYPKRLVYWAFLSEFMEATSHALPLDTDDLIAFLRQRSFERYEGTFRRYFILLILSKLFESNQRLFSRLQYALCTSLVDAFFELMVEAGDTRYLTVVMRSLALCQRLLTHLSVHLADNEHTIARHLLDFVQTKSAALFQEAYTLSGGLASGHEKVLLDENFLKYGHAHKVKKIRLLPYCKANRRRETVVNRLAPLNKQMLIDLLQSCVKDREMFARNFLSSMSSELLLNDAPWMLDEDPKDGQIQHLRMTFEKDLLISRLFDEKPILWNICEIISKGRYLKHCLVIIRSLINVQRANLASSLATAEFREQNIQHVQKIITLISNDEILPQKPFIYTSEVARLMKNWEMSYVLHDIAKYIRDSNLQFGPNSLLTKPYLERLRLIMAHHLPNEVFIKIFKCP